MLPLVEKAKASLPALVLELLEQNADEKMDAILDSLGEDRLQSVLLHYFANQSLGSRFSRALVLGHISSPILVKCLSELLASHTEFVKEICFTLGWIGTDNAVEVLKNSLGSSQEKIRLYATFVLGEVGGLRMAPFIVNMLQDPSDEVREMSAFSIGWNQGNYRVDLLEGLIPNVTDEQEKAIKLALDMIGSKRAKELRSKLSKR